MTVAAAYTRLEALTFTGLVTNRGATDRPPAPPDLPVLVTEDVSQPFVEGLEAWTIDQATSQVTMFVDHVLMIEGIANGTYEERWANIILYLDRYLTAITADITLNDTLVHPLSIIVLNRGKVSFRNVVFSGIRFRHKWNLKI